MTDLNTTTGPVTLDDVRAALGETPSTQTNAGALRRLLGRGSLSTIQKHLDALRAAAAAPVLAAGADAPPPPPADLVAAIWSSAWAQAQARTYGALAATQARVDALAADLALARADALAAQDDADDASAEVQATTAHAESVAAAAAEQVQELAQALDAARAELDQERAARALEAKDAAQAQALMQAQHDAAQAALRAEVDRLVSQLADLRAALSRPAAQQ